MKIEVLSDKSALIERSLHLTVTKMTTAIAERGVCTIALSGGSTPKPLYEAIAAQQLPWEKIHVFWGDERYVPPNDLNSNQLMARQAWLDRVNLPEENIHPIPTDEVEPTVAASKYEEHLQTFFQISSGEFPRFDIILLGMGDDGHTASLFPHTEALQARGLITVGNKQDELRITFTVPLINHARCVMFVVAGADKKSALAQVFATDADDFSYPSRLIQPQGELWWLLDRDAGEELQVSTAAES
ncbi:6-phosphogluconolactonase [Gloeocapsopsis dulcis]|uniref:6-phosphogluconolactonase n=1 Tax=Gloeocapsopsis dulcis AAB1 = 1H9 TaxID=1433147 RepID=A0A6N8FSV3_9CHRO|nr:6-phosphogluconolactonase [Gloeocapsopsis dulcis]MUL35939.1 6-phosphogluconolactonase [Gloeocapsopsis dulcis AAB1 = 1H9]WNN88195.1 6-phosphogluconolactonase [Gloeocapsopsis dulcis]